MANEENRRDGAGLAIGTKIGKYVIREKLGAGGQAIVYKCYDEMLDRYVAVKQIATHLAEDPRLLERFRQEAKILARLGAEEPAIVSIHEFVEEEKGLFIVMDFAEGRTIETILNETKGPLEPKVALQIIWRLAAALHAVHSAGIIHRDIKPSNIVVGENMKVTIADFGVAAASADQTAMLMGTTKYMAPELLEGGKADNRVDMYSLGMIAYEMLAGRPAFNEVFADIIRDKHSEAIRWMKWHSNEKLTAPPLTEVAPGVPVSLSQIVEKMMAKNPDGRFASMEVLGRTIKQSFSQRARKAEAPVAQAVAEAPAAAPAETPGQAEPADVLAEPPATLPLPPKRLSTRTILTLSGVAAVLVLGLGITLGVLHASNRRALTRRANEIYVAAAEAYLKGDYKNAYDKFAKAAKGFPQTTEGIKASVMMPISQAHLALIENDWELAKSAQDRADERVDATQAKYDKLEKWTTKRKEELRNFDRLRTNTRIFVEATSEAQTALEAGNYDEARRILSRQLSRFVPTEQQDAMRGEFLQRIAVTEIRTGVDGDLARGEKLAAEQRFDEAIAACTMAEDRLASGEAGILPKTLREELASRISNAMTTIRDENAYRQAKQRASAARTKNNLRGELVALESAVAIKPSEEDQQRIGELRSEVTLIRARQLAAEGKFGEARKAIALAAKQNPDSQAVKNELKRVDDRAKWTEIVREATADYDAGRYAEALTKYTQAAAIVPDETVSSQIVECRFRVQLVKAETLRSEKKYDEALAAYEELRAIKPSEAARVDALQADLQRISAYETMVAKGNEALAKRKWSDARKYYKQAKGIIPGREADKLIAQARYQENLDKGKMSLNGGDLRGAMAYFKMAQKHMDTKEIRELIAEIGRKLEE